MTRATSFGKNFHVVTVQETIPEALRAEVDAAVAWFNGREETTFEVTGILDPEKALGASGSRALRLVLCGGGQCKQRSFRVTTNKDGYDISLLADETLPAERTPIQPELDPPPGARRAWLDGRLSQHAFVVLVFYRGFW